MNAHNTDPKLKNILDQLAKFGFTFYGYDENKYPLVKGVNGQIVEINVAINFVNKQIESRAQASSGSPENPNFNENADVASSSSVESSVENNVETSVESSVESKAESSVETKSENQTNTNDEVAVQQKAPQIKFEKPKPYGEGFDPISFNPSDINSTLNFIQQNSKKSKVSSNKWIAEQFKKFLKEIEKDVKK